MPISDPANLFQRVPELRALSDDPKISRAIESGDPFKVYRALVLARIFRRLPEHMPILRELTRERRLFARPLKGTPSLGTYNSVGFGFVGESERDSDGSHIALHAFVVLFAIPLIPMGSYLVKSTGERQWQIYARTPLGIMGWLYTRGLALALVIMVLTGAAHSYHASNNQDLTVLNGFAVPLTVRFDDKMVQVPAQGRSKLTLPTGQLHGVASADKAGVVDKLDIVLESSGRTSIWNVAGASPLVQNTVTYYKVKPVNPEGNESQTVYCGKTFLEFDDIKFLFTDPPPTMSMGKHDSMISVRQLAVVSQPDTPGVQSCINYAFDHSQEKEMLKALEALAAFNDWNEGYANAAMFAATNVSTKEALRVAQKALKVHPDNISLERTIQDLREDAGEHASMLTEYAARKDQHPDSANEQYLYAALLSGNEGISVLKSLAQRFPDNNNILRSLAWRRAAHGDAAGALQDLARLHKVAPADASHLLDLEARLLVAQGRAKEALKLLEASMPELQSHAYGSNAIAYYLISRQTGGDAEKYLKTLPAEQGTERTLDVYRARAGLPILIPADARMPVVRLSMTLRSDPGQALTLLRDISPATLTQALSMDQLALLYGEAVRVNDKIAQGRLRSLLQVNKNDFTLLDQYLRGDNVSIDNIDLNLDVQASAHLVRSRNQHLSPQERSGLKQLAVKTDVWQSNITTASKQWQT
ncbi:hypothetical protein [Undibacterium sp. TS12]|uniref:hypothetical protein n=1 Tax=Undibacterium sp. TS12 TaxID=2908202 RepID=UPI001F4C82B9|nr:hypothetical protein [Undibacterium sp. TS12]MCH8620845.1 hypothetical protein [Undibacterium sp. TS12]